MNIMRRAMVLMAALAMVLAGCTRHVSRNITPEGRAGEVVFPSVDDIVLKEGTFPNLDNLRQIGPGVTKEQLYGLIGRPHFREGYFGVREWDYLFHFRREDRIVSCQYKVIFDEQYRGQNFHWAPAACVDLLKPPPPEAPPPGHAGTVKRLTLPSDVLFAFARSGVDDILPHGREQLAAFAQRLRSDDDSPLAVVGHTDRIGSDAANQDLSQRRAQSVRQFLIRQGVAEHRIRAEGRGERQPVKACDEDLGRSALIACLQPNRRVEIVGTGWE